MKYTLKKFIAGPLMANCYVIHDDAKKGIIIDPAGNFFKISKYIHENSINIDYILLTHGHYDHITALKQFKNYTNAHILIHPNDRDMLIDPQKNLSLLSYKKPVIQIDADDTICDGDIINVGNLHINVLHTPGHSPGSVCYVIHDALFSGDTLFAGYVGNTDLLPGSDAQELKNSILNKILTLPKSLILYPGHGIISSIQEEYLKNPYIKSLIS